MCMEQIDPKGNYTGQKMIDFGISRFKDGQEREHREASKLIGEGKEMVKAGNPCPDRTFNDECQKCGSVEKCRRRRNWIARAEKYEKGKE